MEPAVMPDAAWRYLNTGFGSAFSNMAVDEALSAFVARGASGPVLRVFGWSPPAVSFGYAQRVSREIDLPRCRAMGIDVVRRLTGGRAVLHWNELTYSVVIPGAHPLAGGSIAEVYGAISRCLVAGLTRLGVDARLEPGRAPVPSPRAADLTSPCFTSTSQFEVTLLGRKLIGSAQRRMDGVVLQHGSLLIGPEHKRIVDLLPDRSPRLRTAFAEDLDAHTISLSESGRGDLDFAAVAAALREGFAEVLRTGLAGSGLSADERAEAGRLETGKYATGAWNFRDARPAVTRQVV